MAGKNAHQRSLAELTGERLRAALGACEMPYPGPRLVPRQWVDGRFEPRPQQPDAGVRPRLAAVLAIFYPFRRSVRLLLTRRPDYPGHHGGQISLPGGSIEPRDATPLDAALRETEEEVGVPAPSLEFWGSLDPVYIPVSNFIVHPFMAWSSRRPRFRPDPFEVAELLEMPLGVLVDPDKIGEEEWLVRGERRLVPYIRFREHRVWGATAMILDQIRWRLEQYLLSLR